MTTDVRPPPVIQSGPAISNINLRNVETRSVRSVSSKRSRTHDPAPSVSKRARSHTTTSRRSLSPKGTTQEGHILLQSHLRPAQNVLRIGQCKLQI